VRTGWGVAAAIAVLAVLALLAVPRVAVADSAPSTETFDDLVSKSTLVVVASVTVRADQGVVLDVERVLKGASARHIVFEPPTMAPVLDDGGRAVIAFRDQSTIDFRAPTYAWIVGPNGAIDPRGLQRYPGLPATLDAMLTWFHVPAEPNQVFDTAAPARDSPVPALVAIAVALFS
jgi:hypothetical protein